MSGHAASVETVVVAVGTRRHAGRVTVIRRPRMYVECSCGQHIGTALDYIDAKRRWREHKAEPSDA